MKIKNSISLLLCFFALIGRAEASNKTIFHQSCHLQFVPGFEKNIDIKLLQLLSKLGYKTTVFVGAPDFLSEEMKMSLKQGGFEIQYAPDNQGWERGRDAEADDLVAFTNLWENTMTTEATFFLKRLGNPEIIVAESASGFTANQAVSNIRHEVEDLIPQCVTQ